MPTVAYHVTSTRNRDSILRHGLDWARMGGEPGVAGSRAAEGPCVFLARDIEEAEWFVSMSKSNHRAVDVWEVALDHDFDPWDEPPPDGPYRETDDGFLCMTEPVPPERLRLVKEGA